MSLGTRLTLKTATLVLAVLVIAGTAIIGLGTLNRDLDAALVEYESLREIYTYSNQLKLVQTRLSSKADELQPLIDSTRLLVQRFDQIQEAITARRRDSISSALRDVLDQLEQPEPGIDPYEQSAILLNAPLGLLSGEIGDRNERITQIQQQAQSNRQHVQWLVLGIALTATALTIAIGIWQYRAVMNPLNRLQRGVKRLSAGDFSNKLKATGDREFIVLGEEFNRMAEELSTLYKELEEKVRVRSAQLAQSERLASVGFLAAGVAHEINNPLAIIAGEAELALGALPADANSELRNALQTTRDEAFRCKSITEKLITLARPGSEQREEVDLGDIAQEVVAMVRSLPQHIDRAITIEARETAYAMTDPSQIKQVLLNVLINALEAVEPGDGSVQVVVDRSISQASIMVKDNGRGMDAEVLKRVFEPFYTEKKTPTTPGLGLGLSISHAIIEDLGGTLTAASDGPGKGSLFMIDLPGSDESTTS